MADVLLTFPQFQIETEELIRQRAREIAVINGRESNHVLDSDFEQARRELDGQEGLNPSPTMAESLRESERWDPVPGTRGRRAPTVSSPDEQTFAQELVEEGVADAEHDQQLEATREERRRESKP